MKKGDRTRESIIHTSEKLFAQMGYTAVTMKDICEAAELSRGGLYRHFASTKEIFTEILNRDIEKNTFALDKVMQKGIPADKIFHYFLHQEKEAIFSSERGFYFAVHEFAFTEPDQHGYLDERVRKSSEILMRIFRHGQTSGVFRKFDTEAVSLHVLYLLDALKTSSSVLTVTEEIIEKQFNLIWELIL